MRSGEIKKIILEDFVSKFPLSKGEQIRYYIWKKEYYETKVKHHQRLANKNSRLTKKYKKLAESSYDFNNNRK
jgi:hypothetical protein